MYPHALQNLSFPADAENVNYFVSQTRIKMYVYALFPLLYFRAAMYELTTAADKKILSLKVKFLAYKILVCKIMGYSFRPVSIKKKTVILHRSVSIYR